MIDMLEYGGIANFLENIKYPWWCKGSFLRGKYFIYKLRKLKELTDE